MNGKRLYGPLTHEAKAACEHVWDWSTVFGGRSISAREWCTEFRPELDRGSARKAWDRARARMLVYFAGLLDVIVPLEPGQAVSIRLLPAAKAKADEWLRLEPGAVTRPYEIGQVYAREGRLYLAVDSDLLITVIDDDVVERLARRERFVVQRETDVLELEDAWCVDGAGLDAITERYVYPSVREMRDWRERRTECNRGGR